MRDKRAFTFRVERGRFARTVRGHPGSCLAVTLLTILWAVWLVFFKQHGPGSGPPQWTELREYERTLPQHNLSLPLPEGRHGRYVRFNQQIRQLGWNNVLNEILLNLETAHQANRAYVFEDYTWKSGYYPWQPASRPRPPPKTPLNALVSGPLAGGDWDAGDPAPRSVSVAYWETVCPSAQRHVLYSSDLKNPVRDAEGADVFRRMVAAIRDVDAACVEIMPSADDNFPQLYDLWLIGDKRSVSLGQLFLDTPGSRLTGPSPVVRGAVERNFRLFTPRGPLQVDAGPDPFKRMMAVHIRRGDFGPACKERALWASTYYQWNLWPSHPDKFVIPPDSGGGSASDAAKEVYRQHCFPTDAETLATIRRARAEYTAAYPARPLDVLFVLTNADTAWVRAFAETMRAEGWGTVVGTPDLVLDEEQTEVGMAVDMEIARRAEVLIGNGWSSFTSNIIHGRLVDKRPALANRFW